MTSPVAVPVNEVPADTVELSIVNPPPAAVRSTKSAVVATLELTTVNEPPAIPVKEVPAVTDEVSTVNPPPDVNNAEPSADSAVAF